TPTAQRSAELFAIPTHATNVSRSPSSERLPNRDVWDYGHAREQTVCAQPYGERRRRNAYRREQAAETRRCPDVAARRTVRSSAHRQTPTADRARQTSRERTWPVPTGSPNHIRSCRYPDRCPYKYGSLAGGHRAIRAVQVQVS